MTVLITGASGQDGYFLSKYFNRANRRVVGTIRLPLNNYEKARFRYFDDIIQVDLANSSLVAELVSRIRPRYIVNVGAVADSWSQFVDPMTIFSVNFGAVVSMLDSIKNCKLDTVFVQASSSEVFAGGLESPQSIRSCRRPRTIYGASKIAADNIIDIYSGQFGIDCYSVILFSHESPLRKQDFFTKKVINQALDVVEGKSSKIEIHTPTAVRDWGYAGEYCKLLVEHILAGRKGNVILGSGKATSVRTFTQYVCNVLGFAYDDIVVEIPTMKGRAEENIPIVADTRCKSFIGGNIESDVKGLVNLLIRCARYERSCIR